MFRFPFKLNYCIYNVFENFRSSNYSFLCNMPDYNDGVSYFGGTYEAESNRYVFRITKYIQSVISDSTTVNYGLYLLVNAGSINPESFIFEGFKPSVDTADRMKLEILYTDLD